jgi:hypothetical protein
MSKPRQVPPVRQPSGMANCCSVLLPLTPRFPALATVSEVLIVQPNSLGNLGAKTIECRLQTAARALLVENPGLVC